MPKPDMVAVLESLPQGPLEPSHCECEYRTVWDTEVSCFGWYDELVAECKTCRDFDEFLNSQLSTAATGHLLNGLPLSPADMDRLGL